MKKIFNYILPLLLLAGCSKKLEEHPKAIAAETFYNTAAEVETGLNAIYNPIKNPNCMGSLYPAQLETYGDYIYGRGSYGPLNDYLGMDNTNATRAGQIWQLFYQAILDANICLQKIPASKVLTAADKLKYQAEARFLRGLVYFTMARNWGGVVIRTEANMDSINVKRSSLDDTYALILSDLQFAETNLPATPRLGGAPYVMAAKSVLAEVYLVLQQWQKARDEAYAVIQSGKFSLVPVTVANDFNKIFGPDVVSTTEEIFYLKFSRQGANYGFTYAMFEHAPGDGHHGAGGYYAHYSDPALNTVISGWDNNDLRKQYNWYTWNIGLGSTTILPNKFSDPAATNANNAGNDYPWYKYSDILLFYAEAESRVNGVTASAVDALNQVHRRAYGYAPTQTSAVDFVGANFTPATFLDMVVKERNYETCNEAKRWLDLKRLGTVKQVILAVKGKTVADKMLLWPIPTVETTYNTAIDPVKDQNPGY
ncbi:MAG: RagB/SusD family nutrient uptake outer membrane protein [Chitinophagaceae bacterium]